MSYKGIFEDDSEEESESGEDFSASEDEWKPGKDDAVSDDDDENIAAESSNDDASDDENQNVGSKKKNAKKTKGKVVKKGSSQARKSGPSSQRRQTSSLRSKLFRRYNPPPKTVSRSPVPAKVADILSNSQYKARSQLEKKPATSVRAVFSDSESSADEGLVNPNELDFNSEFFDVKAIKSRTNEPSSSEPVFDCNAGMKLSDSDDDDDDDDFAEVANESNDNETSKKTSSIINQINSKSGNQMHDFSSLQNFAQNLESAKAQLAKLKQKDASGSAANAGDESDITKLLSMGEGSIAVSATTSTTPSTSQRKRKHKDGQHSDDSEWENVSDNDEHGHEIKDIQITVGNSVVRGMTREQKKAIDLEACLKRRLNRDIKIKQVCLHKTSVLCWIAHGNYINRCLNNLTLMEMCIKLLPSKNAYPKGDTDVKYYNMITDWFHTLFQLKSDKLYCELKRLPPRIQSLALQIQTKKIISKCDFVLIFVTMLRSLGIQCRLVINLAVPPQQPPQKDLFHISTKPKEAADETNATDKTKSDAKPSLSKKIKVSVDKMKKSTEKFSTSKEIDLKATKTSKSKSKPSASATEHSYAEKHPFEKVKVKLSRMSESFVEKNTAISTKRRSDSNERSPNKSSQSPSSKSTKSKADDKSSASKRNGNLNGRSTARLNGKVSKAKEIDNAVAGTQHSPSKSNASKQIIVGTPTKHKLIERTNSMDVSKNRPADKKNIKEQLIADNASVLKAISPRKTRSKSNRTSEAGVKVTGKLKLPQLDGAHDHDDGGSKKKARTKAKSRAKPEHSSGDDSDFEPTPQKKLRCKITPPKPAHKAVARTKKIDARVFSTDEEADADTNTVKMNFWVEAYAEKEKKWITIDPVKKKVDCVDFVRKHASKPIIYVFAWNNDNRIRDVTPRYCSQFHTTTRKLRAEQMWIDEALERYIEHRNPRTIIEDVEFSKLHMDQPLPTSINEFKNHPLYALERHLLKFEAIYPPNALTLGYIRNEPVFSRDCVHTLHSREIWVKQARTVKIGEKPYKIVKARPKWNRMLNQMEEAKPLEIFGFWQTEPYQPPVAENGLVPRNPYGNVELFKPEMLPIGTRHIQLPNLNRVCKKMGVDCAQAVIGFDFHSGSSHPTFDGFVVCEEFADAVIKQWEIDQEELVRKETEKREARIFGNWKKLIKGLLIRERLKRKFNFGTDDGGASSTDAKSHGGKRKKA